MPRKGDVWPTDAATAVDANDLPWEEVFVRQIGAKLQEKYLLKDADRGVEVWIVKYPAGVVATDHRHPCAHGIFVLEGTLVTHLGTHPKGSFVWFPEGVVQSHGASLEGDATLLFMTNKPFGIEFLSPQEPTQA